MFSRDYDMVCIVTGPVKMKNKEDLNKQQSNDLFSTLTVNRANCFPVERERKRESKLNWDSV